MICNFAECSGSRPGYKSVRSAAHYGCYCPFVSAMLCAAPTYIHTYTRLTAPLSGTTRVTRYRKSKTNLDFTETTDSEWQRHQLGHMQVCTSLQTDNHASTPPLSFFTSRMPFLAPKQQRRSTEGSLCGTYSIRIYMNCITVICTCCSLVGVFQFSRVSVT